MIRYLFIVFVCAVIFSCGGNGKPKDVLEPEKMQAVLWDYMRADAFTSDFLSKDSSKNLSVENVKLQKAVFAKHKVSKEIFYTSFQYYESHPEQFQRMLDTLINRKRKLPGERLQKKIDSTLF